MLYKLKHGLLKKDSKYVPTAGNQKKSHHQTSSCSFDVPFHRTQHQQQTFFPRTVLEWNSLPEAVATVSSLASFKSRVQNHL